ncbi:MAG: hypothetical protein ABIF10_04575 [Candidatus Woesearchaeota archaeon]
MGITIAEFAAWLTYFFVVVIFYVLFALDSKVVPAQVITSEIQYPDMELFLLNLMRTPYQGVNLADVIANGVEYESSRSLFSSNANKRFGPVLINDIEEFKNVAAPVVREFVQANFGSSCYELKVSRQSTAYISIIGESCLPGISGQAVVMVPSVSPGQPPIKVSLEVYARAEAAFP